MSKIKEKEEEQKIYYAYSEFDAHLDEKSKKIMPNDRGVVAVTKVGDKLIYGISVCTVGDTFNKEEGRKLAAERLAHNFGVIKLEKSSEKIFKKLGEQRGTIFFVQTIANSIAAKPSKYKRKIEAFNIAHGFEHGTTQKKKEAAVKSKASKKAAKKK